MSNPKRTPTARDSRAAPLRGALLVILTLALLAGLLAVFAGVGMLGARGRATSNMPKGGTVAVAVDAPDDSTTPPTTTPTTTTTRLAVTPPAEAVTPAAPPPAPTPAPVPAPQLRSG